MSKSWKEYVDNYSDDQRSQAVGRRETAKKMAKGTGCATSIVAGGAVLKAGYEIVQGNSDEALGWGVAGGLIIAGVIYLLNRFRNRTNKQFEEDLEKIEKNRQRGLEHGQKNGW